MCVCDFKGQNKRDFFSKLHGTKFSSLLIEHHPVSSNAKQTDVLLLNGRLPSVLVQSQQLKQMQTIHCVVMFAHLQRDIHLISVKNALTLRMVNQHVFIQEQLVVLRPNGQVLHAQ